MTVSSAKMVALDALLEQLAEGLMTTVGDADDMVRVQVDAVDVSLPVETALRPGGGAPEFLATLPRSRQRTGFDQPLGRLRVRFERRVAP